MKRALMLGIPIMLLGAGLALAQAPENALPEGTFASTSEDCTKLATKTPADLGDDFDFEVLTKKGFVAFQQTCDFVNVFAHDAKSWVATAFCDEAGYTYPDMFSIKQKDDGKLNVTRLTDLTQQGSDDQSSQSDTEESDGPEQSAGGKQPETAGGPSGDENKSDDEQASESYSSFVKCEHVKP